MDDITALTKIDFSSVFISVCLIFAAFKAVVSLFEWVIKKLGLETKYMRSKREDHELLLRTADSITAISKKLDEQSRQLIDIDLEGKNRDCAILRDRLIGGIRYFEQNRDEDGIVHIKISDHENMKHLFEAYFGCRGNGTIRSIYDNEFKNWIIDK